MKNTIDNTFIASPSINRAIARAEALCRQRGLRFTAIRRQVLAIIWTHRGAIKAYDILERMGGANGNAKPPTVYRALDFLLANGLVHKINSQNSYIGCPRPTTHHHTFYFLICSDCGHIIEHCNDQLTQAIVSTTHQKKFQCQRVSVEIEGYCQQCRKTH